MASVRDLLRAAEALPGDSPRRDGEILLGHCLQQPRAWLYTWPEREVPAALERGFRDLLARRAAGEPVAHLTGMRDFWSLSLRVSAATLIPRPETETLVDWALELSLPDAAAVLDLGTGSGAIALAVASERPGWQVSGVDRSEQALQVARDNAQRCGLSRVHFRYSHWFRALAGERFDLLLANPPYIDPADAHLSRGDLRFEPRAALVAAEQGLADLRHLIAQAPQFLRAGGHLLLEHGADQGAAVRALLQHQGFQAVSTRRDLAGHERISGGYRDAQ